MNRVYLAVIGVAATLGLGACKGLEARYHQPALPVTDAWPIPPATAEAGAAADIGWRDFYTDERLRKLIAQALGDNRDLRVAVLNVEKARATYQVQRAARLPEIDATGSLVRERASGAQLGLPAGSGGAIVQYESAGVGISGFELDLFGRVASLSHAALQQYFADADARRAAQLSLIAEVANAYLTLAADIEHERLGDQTLESQAASYRLTEQRHALGAVSALDLSQARTTVEAARADAARYRGAVALDRNALTLLVGAPLDPALLPDGFGADVAGAAPLPAGLPSSVLLRRPDVRQAEHVLRAADATIGAARAAFFPSITLTGNFGSTSTELSGLFKSGTGTWSFMPQVNLPIFAAGRLRANLHAVTAERDIAVARYEGAIQSAFREVADALALTGTLREQNLAQSALAEATGSAFKLSEARYKAGKDSYLTMLDSQRSDYGARQALIATRLAEESNRVTLYKVLGGGWREEPAR